MTTRAQIVTAAATRLGDTSAAFLAVLDPFFDDVLLDLAQAEAISDLREEASFTIVANQESYSTQAICGLAANVYPLRVLKVTVPSWGTAGAAPYFRQAENAAEYDRLRQGMPDLRGTAALWRLYPNRRQLQLWPPASSEQSGAGLGRVLFTRAPAVLAGNGELVDVGAEDHETVKWGIIARGATFRDETMAEADHALTMYERGKQAMWARLQTTSPGRIAPRDF